jgi:hypothetical protein
LHEAALELAHAVEAEALLDAGEEGDAGAEDDRDDRDGEIVEEARREELLDDDAAIDVEAARAVGREAADERVGGALERLFATVAANAA